MTETKDKIKVEAADAKEKFERWLREDCAVGVFANHDLGSTTCGHMIFLQLDSEDLKKCVAGKTRAPDGTYGPGWRYLLDEIVTDLSRFEFAEQPPPTAEKSCAPGYWFVRWGTNVRISDKTDDPAVAAKSCYGMVSADMEVKFISTKKSDVRSDKKRQALLGSPLGWARVGRTDLK